MRHMEQISTTSIDHSLSLNRETETKTKTDMCECAVMNLLPIYTKLPSYLGWVLQLPDLHQRLGIQQRHQHCMPVVVDRLSRGAKAGRHGQNVQREEDNINTLMHPYAPPMHPQAHARCPSLNYPCSPPPLSPRPLLRPAPAPPSPAPPCP